MMHPISGMPSLRHLQIWRQCKGRAVVSGATHIHEYAGSLNTAHEQDAYRELQDIQQQIADLQSQV